jgi:hypothetical protein
MYQSTVGKIPIAIILVTLKGCWNIQGSGAGYITEPASNLVLKPYPSINTPCRPLQVRAI